MKYNTVAYTFYLIVLISFDVMTLKGTHFIWIDYLHTFSVFLVYMGVYAILKKYFRQVDNIHGAERNAVQTS